MKSDYIWIDGNLVPFEEATVHMLSPAIHYGLAVFEGIRCYETVNGPGVFRLREHIERLVKSAQIFGVLDLPYDVQDLYDATLLTIRANRFTECYIRPLIYMADGPLGLNLDTSRPAVSISTWEWGKFLGDEAFSKGARMIVSSFTRLHPNVHMTKAKISGNYVNSVMAKTLAVRAGFDEAVMLDPDGYVAECTGENLFIVRNGRIHTPPRATILEGVTRDSVITIARDLNIPVVEEKITRDQLYIADEMFVCGTAAEITHVAEIDYRVIGDGQKGPVARQIQETFFKTVKGEGVRSEEWLDMVPEAEYSMGI